MKVIEENNQKMVLAGDSRALDAEEWGIVLLISGGLLVYSVYAAGVIPNTGPYEVAAVTGRIALWPLVFSVGLVVAGLSVFVLYELFRTYSVVVLDKSENRLILRRVRARTHRSTTVRVVELRQVRRVLIGDNEDAWRLEFELKDGEILAPRRTYSSAGGRPAFFALVEKIHRFLGIAPQDQLSNWRGKI